jgi:cell division protein FtsB
MKIFGTKRFFGFTTPQITILGALIIALFFFSDSSIMKWLRYESQIRNLESQIEHYRNRTEIDSRKLQELRSNIQDLEKFARENFLMKRDNEDLFIIVE